MIDPSIAAGVKPIQLNNPLEQYGQALQYQGMQQTNAFNRLKMDEIERERANQNALSGYYRESIGPDGTLNRGKFKSLAAAGGHGHLIPDLEKKFADLDKTGADTDKIRADGQKTYLEALTEGLDVARRAIEGVQTYEDAAKWVNSQFDSELFSGLLTRAGMTREQEIAKLQNAVNTNTFADWLREKKVGSEEAANQMMEQSKLALERDKFGLDEKKFGLEKTRLVYTNQDTGGTSVLLASPAYDGNGKTTKVSEIKNTESPKAPRTTVNVDLGDKIETAGGMEFSKLQAKELTDLKKAAMDAPRLAREADRTLDLVEGGEIFKGKLANVQMEAARLAKALGVPVDDKLKNTQVLTTILANKVLAAVQTSGLGASNAFSDKDREFVERAAGGQITLDEGTLLELARIQRDAANFAINRYNEVAATAPNSWFAGSGARRKLDLIPERKPKGNPAPKKPGTPTKNGGDHSHLWK